MPVEKSANGDPVRGYEALTEICAALADTPDERELTNRILEIICRVFEVDVCSLRLLDDLSGELVLARSRGMPGYSKPVRLGESVVGRAVLERKPYLIENLDDSPYKKSPFAARTGLSSLISVPLLLRERAVGGLTVYSRHVDNFSRSDVHLLCAIASQIASILENGRLIRDTVSTLVSLARAIDAKDRYTQGHSARVTAYAALLAEKVGIEGTELAMLKQIGPMHDIGKIGISEAIINKPARLSPQERRVMQQHPVIGERIVNSIRSFQPGLYLVRNHHENFDGAGYPDGLRGDEIPLAARVLRIADTWDAMTTRRPYRDPLDSHVAFEELRAHAGTHFDADLVGEFGELKDDGALELD
ncbi:MAG: HD domain-containing phosphohydrolase [Planctomycetota bacterium]|jgi:putative methionine-R-sulfoxide reductase with GAF domain